jgi:hypothetical protein
MHQARRELADHRMLNISLHFFCRLRASEVEIYLTKSYIYLTMAHMFKREQILLCWGR